MSGTNEVSVRKIMSFNPADLDDGKLFAKEYQANQKVTYNGKKVRVLNVISDSFKVDIVAGNRLEICKNQFIHHRDFASKENSGPKVVLAHFKLIGNGTNTGCTCGACGFKWHFEEDICDCEEKPPIDPGEQQCSIQ